MQDVLLRHAKQHLKLCNYKCCLDKNYINCYTIFIKSFIFLIILQGKATNN